MTALKRIPREERLIAALDVADAEQAKAMVQRLGDSVRFYKVGLELFMAGGVFEFIDWLAKRGNKVFETFPYYTLNPTSTFNESFY